MDNQSLPVVGESVQQTATPVQVAVRAPEHATDESAVPYRMLHQALRGRYLLAIVLGAVLAALLGYAAWDYARPVYRSESLLRIPYDPPRLNQGADTRSIEAFEAYMSSQQALLTSNRLMTLALQDEAWKQKGFQPERMSAQDIAGDLQVDRRAGMEHIKVSATNQDRQKAALIVRTVVNAYVSLHGKLDKQAESEKTVALRTRQKELQGQISERQAALNKEASEFGSANVGQFYDQAVGHLTKIESMLVDVRIAMALASIPRQNAAPGTVRMMPQQMARSDPRMAKYLADREEAETVLQELRLRGYGEEHNQVVQAKKRLDYINGRIQAYALELQKLGPEAAPLPEAVVPGQNNGLIGKTLDELKVQEKNLTALSDTEKQTMLKLGAKKITVDGIRAETDRLGKELEDVNQRIRAMELEAGLSGGLTVLSEAEVPANPMRDRRMQYAVAGAVGGFFLPAAVLAGFGIMHRRYRYSDDATGDMEAQIPLLGVLPQLPERLSDVEMAADAAQCLHQIRVMLQIQAQTTGSVCYLMTSACPGEGKTSLTAALALSFAAAGARTLVIDADMIGQRLTRGYRLDDRPGLREAMYSGLKESMICDGGVPGLYILPVGTSDGRDACAVSHKALRRILASVREHYDIVLIDSGPILGSIEAMVIAGIADAVVLTVSRQQQKPLVDRAIRQLRSANARIAGLVFNKAERRDFRRSVGVSSLRSISANADSGTLVKAGVTSTSGFGSLVDSVRTYLPAGG